jgi:hypothetical protein
MTARTTKPLTVEQAAELSVGFGPPPVLSSENKEHYDMLRNESVAYYHPTTIWHLSLIRELVDTQWEILRVSRYRTAVIERYYQYRIRQIRKTVGQMVQKREEEVRELLPHFHHDFVQERVSDLQTGIAMLKAPIEEFAQPNDAKHCLALEQAAKFVKELDKLHKNAAARRNNLLKILEYYRPPIDQETETSATAYNEVTEEKFKQIAAPLVPPELLTNDVTTQNQAVKAAQKPSTRGRG